MLGSAPKTIAPNINQHRNKKEYPLIHVNNLLRIIAARLKPDQDRVFKEPHKPKPAEYLSRTIHSHLGAVNQEEYDALTILVDTTITEMQEKMDISDEDINHILAHLAKKCISNGMLLREGDAAAGTCWTIFLSQLRLITQKHAEHFFNLRTYDRFKKDKVYSRNEEITLAFQKAYLSFMGQLEKNADFASTQAIHTFLHILFKVLQSEKAKNAEKYVTDPYNYVATNINTCLLIGLEFDYQLWPMHEKLSEEALNTIRLIEYDFMACFVYAIMHLEVFETPYNGRNYQNWQQDPIVFDNLNQETISFMWNAPQSPLFLANHPETKKFSMKTLLQPLKKLSFGDHQKLTEMPPSKAEGKEKERESKEDNKGKKKTSESQARPRNYRARLKKQPKSDTNLLLTKNPKKNESAIIIAKEGLSPRYKLSSQASPLEKMSSMSLRTLLPEELPSWHFEKSPPMSPRSDSSHTPATPRSYLPSLDGTDKRADTSMVQSIPNLQQNAENTSDAEPKEKSKQKNTG